MMTKFANDKDACYSSKSGKIKENDLWCIVIEDCYMCK